MAQPPNALQVPGPLGQEDGNPNALNVPAGGAAWLTGADAVARQRASDIANGLMDPNTGQLTPAGRAAQIQAIMGGFGPADIGMAGGFMAGVKPRIPRLAGELEAWHGTRAEKPVVEFSQEAAQKTGRWTKDEAADIGFHFSPEKETAEIYGTPSRYYLNMERPLRVTERDVEEAQNQWLNDLEWSENPSDQHMVDFIRSTKAFDNPGSGFYNQGLKILSDKAKAAGHDGMIFNRQRDFTDDRMIDEYIAFHPKQIRPAD